MLLEELRELTEKSKSSDYEYVVDLLRKAAANKKNSIQIENVSFRTRERLEEQGLKITSKEITKTIPSENGYLVHRTRQVTLYNISWI